MDQNVEGGGANIVQEQIGTMCYGQYIRNNNPGHQIKKTVPLCPFAAGE